MASTSTLTLRNPEAEYTIVKSVEPSSGGVLPGETVTYTLTLQNVSDVDLWDFREVVDDLSDVLDDADYNGDATLTGSWSGDVPSPGGRPVFDANDPSFPCLTTTTPVIDVQSWKQVMADPTPVQAGTVLTYTLFFDNVGGTTETVDRVDDLTHVIDDADVVSEPVASDPALTAERDGAQVTVTGQLAPGQTVTVSLTVRVRPDGDRGDNILANFLTLLLGQDCTSTPVGELAVTKSVDPASGSQVAPGDELDYTLTVTNTGTAPASVDHTDHLAGLADDTTLLDGPTPSDPALTVSDVQNDEYTITGTLAAGQTVTVTYTVEVKPRDELGDRLLENQLTPTGENPPGQCRDTIPLCTVNPVTPPDLPDTGNDLATRLLIGAIAALFAGLVLLVASRRAALLAAAI